MTRISEKMICTDCSAEMNHHAMKLDYSVEGAELQEIHTCPECGHSDLRPVE